MRLPDPRRSYAVLIGTSTYHSAQLTDLPAVGNNLTALAGVLTDPALGGLPAERCIVLPNPTDVRAVYRALRQYAGGAEDTLVVYFAGHGRTGPRNELYLSLADTDPDELRVSALPFDLVREVLGDSPAVNRVLILDCCFSGRAIPDMGGPEDAILGQVGIEGTYTLVATPANAVALAPAGDAYTAFTGELLTLLRTGMPAGPEVLTLAAVYRQLLHSMTARGLPRPGQRGTGTVDQLALTRNPAHPANPPSTSAGGVASTRVRHGGAQDGHGVEFRESLRCKDNVQTIAGMFLFVPLAVLFWFCSFIVLATGDPSKDEVWQPMIIVGPLTLIFSLTVAIGIADILNRPQLGIDSAGISLRYREGILRRAWGARFPWSELSTVEFRWQNTATVLSLVCTPKPGSTLPADERAVKLWSEDLRGFVVIDVTTLRGSPQSVGDAITRFSSGRYRPVHAL